MRRRSTTAMLFPLLIALAFASIGACEQQGHGWATRVVESNVEADQALARDDLPGARTALESLLEPPPAGVSPADHRIVAADAAYRLARIELDAGDPSAALGWTERGLALGDVHDIFRANLLVARGRSKEALGRATEAAADYHEALVVNEELLDHLLEPQDDP